MSQIANELLYVTIVLAAIYPMLTCLLFLEEALKLLSAMANVQAPDLVEVIIEVPKQIRYTVVTLHLLLMMRATLGGLFPHKPLHIFKDVLNLDLSLNESLIFEHQEEMIIDIIWNLPVLYLLPLLFMMGCHCTYYTCFLGKNKVITALVMNLRTIFWKLLFLQYYSV